MIIGTVHRIHREITERIVHPAHVPLEGEAQTAVFRSTGHFRPRSGFLGDHHRLGIVFLHSGIEHLEEFHRFEILMTAIDIGHPLAVVAVVIEVEHGGNRVHAQTVDVIFIQPEERVGNQERTHFVATEIEYTGAPFFMLALAPIRIFISRCTVKTIQTVRVLREVGGNPVHDDADAVFMQDIHEPHEILGFTVAGSRGIVAADLIAP